MTDRVHSLFAHTPLRTRYFRALLHDPQARLFAVQASKETQTDFLVHLCGFWHQESHEGHETNHYQYDFARCMCGHGPDQLNRKNKSGSRPIHQNNNYVIEGVAGKNSV